MKYSVGDKVRIKTWEEIVKDHNVFSLHPASLKYLGKNANNKVIKIGHIIGEYCYRENGSEWNWMEYMIEGLEFEKIYKPIENRWEILDL